MGMAEAGIAPIIQFEHRTHAGGSLTSPIYHTQPGRGKTGFREK